MRIWSTLLWTFTPMPLHSGAGSSPTSSPEKGVTAGESRFQRLCRDHSIRSVFSKKRALSRKPGPPVRDDLVEQDFTATAPNELWLPESPNPQHNGLRVLSWAWTRRCSGSKAKGDRHRQASARCF